MILSRRAAALAVLLGAVACKKEEPAPAQPPPTPAVQVTADAAPVAKVTPPDAAAAATVDAGAVATGDQVKGFFYEVSKDGKVAGHMLGTMHLGVDPDKLPPAVYTALGSAKTFAMEADITDPSLMNDVMRSDGKTLEDELGEKYWKKLEDALGNPMIAQSINKMKPEAASEMLEIRGLPLTFQPMDLALLGKAKGGGLKIVYLEEAKLQEQILDKWLDATALKEELDDVDKVESNNKEMLESYKTGDEATVAKLTADKSEWKRSPAEFDEMMNDILYNRNKSWIPELEKMFTDGDAFVAVGAAHLIGDRSVTDLLTKDGWTVKRVGP